MLTPDEAEKLILGAIRVRPPGDCPLDEAQGRVLREDVRADRDMPPFDRATLDGYALRAASLASGLRTFRVEAVQAAGAPPLALGPEADACIEIMTGAAMPAGADCVVPCEDTLGGAGGPETGEAPRPPLMRVTPGAAAVPGGAVHRKGGDHRRGEIVVPAGVRLTGREIAVAAACGRGVLSVGAHLGIAVVSTGDELVEVEAVPAPHQIRTSNGHALRAALMAAGHPLVERFHLRDTRGEIARGLGRVLDGFDVVVLTGGVSKGKFDFLPSELEKQGVGKLFHGVAQRPGRPFWFGVGVRGTPVFALPGNPVSAYACLHRYVIPALGRATGLAPPPRRTAALAGPVAGGGESARLLPVRLACGPRAELLAEPRPPDTSGDFAGLVGTDGFVELPAGRDEFPAGSLAPFWPWF